MATPAHSPHAHSDADSLRDLIAQRDAEIAAERAQREAQQDRENWLASLDRQIRDLFGSKMDAYSQQVLHLVVKRYPSLIGGMYALRDADKTHARLELMGTYGMTKAQAPHTSLQLGEGLAGESARTGERITHAFDSSDTFEFTQQALVKMKPKSVLLQPLSFNGIVVGVLELYLSEQISEGELSLLEDASNSIASALAAKLKQEEVQKLLDESQSLISQQQAQEEELRQNMEELQSTQEEMERMQLELRGQIAAMNAAALVSEADVQGNITFVNETFCKVSQYMESELLGNNHRMLKGGKQPQKIFDEMWATISSGNIWRGELQNKKKDGSFYWVAASITPVLDADKKPVKYIGVRFDITEQKNQEQELQQVVEEMQAQEEEMRQNMEELQATQEEITRMQTHTQSQVDAINRSMGMLELDPQGNIQHVNDKYLGFLGYTREALVGKHYHSILPKEDAEAEGYAPFWQTLLKGDYQIGEFRNQSQDDSEVWVYATYNPVMEKGGEVSRIIVFAADITERKKQDAELVRMEHLNEALEEVRVREEEISRLLEVTQLNEKQMQDSEKQYRTYIEKLSQRVKQLELENENLCADKAVELNER